MTISVDNDKLLVPDYEGHYQELLTKLKEHDARLPTPVDMWSVACGVAPRVDAMSPDEQCELIADISVLQVLLIYVDLAALGIAPDLAKLVLLARLLADDAPVGLIKHDLISAVITVVDAAHAAKSSAKA
jgi:hypothetical protein